MKKGIFLFTFLFFCFSVSAQQWLWGRQGTNSSDTWGVACDNFGNAFLSGCFGDTITFENIHLSSNSLEAFLVKYDSNGKVLWAKQSLSASRTSSAGAVFQSTDLSGNIYLTGNFYDTVSFGSFTLIENPTGRYNAFLVKYDGSGNVIWAKQSTGSASPNSVACDGQGNAFLAGNFVDTISFGSVTLKSIARYNGDGFITKFDPNGNVIWGIQSHLNSPQCWFCPNSIVVDSEGYSFVTGTFLDTVTIGGYTLKGGNTNSTRNVFVMKCDPDGNVLWVNQSQAGSSPFGGQGYSITLDSYGSVYITGGFNSPLTFGPYTVTSGFVFLVKYSNSGNVIWAKQCASGAGTGYSLSADKHGDIYFSGNDGGSPMVFCNYTFNESYLGDASVIMELDTSGNALCGSFINAGGDDFNTVACSPSGRFVYFGGDNALAVRFNNDSLIYLGSESPFIARWQPCYVPPKQQIIPNAVEPCNSLFIPNAFSPNGDQQNDVLYVRGNCMSSMDFTIFDRWGNKVFESENQNIGWDGNYKGQPMNTGTYVWYLKGTMNDGTAINKKGTVALIR